MGLVKFRSIKDIVQRLEIRDSDNGRVKHTIIPEDRTVFLSPL